MNREAESLLPVGSIRVLPEGVANRIAAGEVVERPASVAKELIENALDAEAGRIILAVKKAGFDELLVSDDGWGMDEKDLLLAFRRHATSKITSAEDLERITHLGFRGEALPSIASVARVEVTSRREDRESGVRYTVAGGKPSDPEPAARERGTTVRIRSLFYNVPARRRFLRTPATEYGHIVRVFKQYALAYPELHWTLIRDGETVWELPSTDLQGRIVQFFGKEAESELHEASGRSGNVLVEGIVGGSGLFRKSRGEQFLYVNRRPIQSTSLHHAVVNGFGPLLQAGQVPFYVLFLRLDPTEFDVNVHPAKHEIRFRDEGNAYRAVLLTTRNALGGAIRAGGAPVGGNWAGRREGDERASSVGRFPGGPKTRTVDGFRELELLFGKPGTGRGGERGESAPGSPGEGAGATTTAGEKVEADGVYSTGAAPFAGKYDPHIDPPAGGVEAPLEHEAIAPAAGDGPAERINVWQLHRTYILSQVKSGLVIIDQHVAHERILYERALSAMRDRSWNAQQLLFPVEVRLDPEDSALLEELAPQLRRLGFDVETSGDDAWSIRSLPAGVRIKSEERLLRDILGDYRQEFALKLSPEESLAASFACKAAIKAGDPLNLEEMNALIDELFQTKYPFVCPHGRPVVINLTLTELHKLFGRQ